MKEAIQFDPHFFEGEFCFLNGTCGLDQTDQALYEYLVDRNFYPLVLDELFDHPDRIHAIKPFNPTVIIVGTTGTYEKKLNIVKQEFVNMQWLPKYAIFTMGEEFFCDIIKKGVVGYKIYPYSLHFKNQGMVPQIAKLHESEF
jgi:hypothetical protein